MKKRLLITGSNGFIGKNFIEYYSKEYEIIEVTKYSKYNILDLNSLLTINNIDVVLHFAAKTFVPHSFDNPYEFYEFNIKSTLNIAELCRIKKIKKIIYLNSYTYGNPQYLPIDEKHPISFHSPYNKSKFLAEEVLFNYLENYTDVISLRLFNIYGKYQNNNFLIPSILNQISTNEITVKDLNPKRDYLYIKDLIALINIIINTKDANGVYNIGSGASYSVIEIIDMIKTIYKYDFVVKSQNIVRQNEVMDCYANINKLKKEFKWSPSYSLYTGLEDYLQEVKNV